VRMLVIGLVVMAGPVIDRMGSPPSSPSSPFRSPVLLSLFLSLSLSALRCLPCTNYDHDD
jgi:hypothetical protein